MSIFLKLQILDFIELNSKLILCQEGIFLDESIEMFKSLNGDFLFWSLFLHGLFINPGIK